MCKSVPGSGEGDSKPSDPLLRGRGCTVFQGTALLTLWVTPCPGACCVSMTSVECNGGDKTSWHWGSSLHRGCTLGHGLPVACRSLPRGGVTWAEAAPGEQRWEWRQL